MVVETSTERRIIGPPGTGKTSFLAKQVQLDAERYGSDAIVITSLTRAAAAEIAGRDLSIPREHVATLHAHCYRALDRPPIAETKIAEWNEAAPEYRMSGGRDDDLDDLSTDALAETPADELMAQMQLLRARMTPRELWPLSVRAFAQRWGTWKAAQGYIDFTDMIEIAAQSVDRAPGNPRVLMVDEAQDLDRLEMSVLRAWGRHVERLYIVGDPDQAIYTFRGSDPAAFTTPSVPEDQRRVLSQSHRVPRAVHERATRWIAAVPGREPVAYQPRDADGVVRRLSSATSRHPEALIPDIERQLAVGRTVMVLASCSYMLAPTIAVLRREGLPFHNPYRRKRGDWNPLTPAKGQSMASRLLALLRPQEDVWGEDARMWGAGDLKPWVDVLKAELLWHSAKAEIGRLSVQDAVTDDDLARWLPPATWQAAMWEPLDFFERGVLSAKVKALAFPMAVARKRGAVKLRDEPRVIVSTIHACKGGESDVVFLMPDISRSAMEGWLRPGEGRDAVRRCFYVGMTRAREELVICGQATRYAVDL